MYLFLAVLGLCCCVGFSLVVARGASSLAAGGLLIRVASHWGTRALGLLGFSSCSPWALGHRLSGCSVCV